MKYLIILFLLAGNVLAQTPLGTEFTYQGELKDNLGNPLTGSYDLKFVAFDASADGMGNNLGTSFANDIQATNGVFTTSIDFGDMAFVGDKVWIEINIRPGTSTGGYQQLLPRQAITAAPYATHAQFVGANAVSDIEIQDNSISLADMGNNSVNSSKIVDGTIMGQDIGLGTINGNNIRSRTITTAEVAKYTIGDINLASNSVISSKIASGAVGNNEISSSAVDSLKIMDGSILAVDVDTSQIQKRINGSCIYPEYVTSIDVNGSVVCDRAPLSYVSTLDSGTIDQKTSIAIGTDGNPIISYYDFNNKDLKIIKCQNQSCSLFDTPRTLDSMGDVGNSSSIAIGADCNPIISYSDFTNNDLKIIKCQNQSCSLVDFPRTLDSTGDVGTNLSIAIGTDGYPIISYLDGFPNYDLKIVKCHHPFCIDFDTRTLDSSGDVGGYTSIAIGTDGKPIISYIDFTFRDLKIYSCGDEACSR
jgi:hypothetical protein